MWNDLKVQKKGTRMLIIKLESNITFEQIKLTFEQIRVLWNQLLEYLQFQSNAPKLTCL